MKARKGKKLEGLPRTGRWTRQAEERRQSGDHTGSLIALALLAVVVLGGVGTFGYLLWQQLDAGLLAQQREATRRPDWVRLDELPAYVPAAFVAVVDTASFTRLPQYRRPDGPLLTRDLIRQIYRLGPGLQDEARELAMAPLLEARTSQRRLLELYLNRVYLGEADDWPVYGVYHASREYFGKDPSALSVAEAATLAAILLPPRLPDPESTPGAIGPRRNEVLRLLLARGAIDAETFRRAAAEPLGFQPGADYAPMTRPLDWEAEPDTIRLPPELRPEPLPAATPPAEAGE